MIDACILAVFQRVATYLNVSEIIIIMEKVFDVSLNLLGSSSRAQL